MPEREALDGRHPLVRLARAGEAGEAIARLAVDACGTTGTVLAVDGGIHDLRP